MTIRTTMDDAPEKKNKPGIRMLFGPTEFLKLVRKFVFLLGYNKSQTFQPSH